MIKFISILSILIYTSYSQTCGNSHDQSTFLSVSINGRSVNQIGVQSYIDTVKLAAQAIIPTTGTQNVGLLAFGGTTNQGVPVDDFFMDQTMTTGGYSTIEGLLTNLATTHDFDLNYGNSVRSAVDQAILQTWNGQKYHVLFAAGNPLANQGGSTTNPTNVDKICSKAIEAKQNNIQTYVALIGEEGINFIKEFYNCLVEDPATDIIVIDPTNSQPGIDALLLRVCKTDGIDFKITEVNPISGQWTRYIEVLNRGVTVSLKTCFDDSSDNTCSTSASTAASTATGDYYVGYGGAGTNPTGQSGLGTSVGSEGWTARAYTATAGGGTNSVTHSTGNFFQNQITAYGGTGSPQRSFALRAVGFNNQYGLNWRMTCGTSGGTPGSDPAATCVAASSCDTNTCSASSTGTENCDSSGDFCLCAGTYFGDGDTCISKPTTVAPVGGCKGYTIPDPVTGNDWTYFVWSLPYDGKVQFSMQYQKTGGNDETFDSDVSAAPADSIRPVDLDDGVADIVITTTAFPPLGSVNSETTTNLACQVGTLAPTKSPTTDPTSSPAKTPTTSPTSPPTYDSPGVFIAENGACAFSRCNCYEDERVCCTPFGPQYGTTMTTGVVASRGVGGCTNVFKSYDILSADQNTGMKESIFITKYGEPVATTIFYRITALGQINQTEFENLTRWSNYYDPATWSGRRLGEDLYDLENDNLGRSRSLLQTTTAPVTPAPTTEFGNKLNIEVTPPGLNSVYTGSVTMPDGSSQIDIPINISVATLKCARGQDCTTYDECKATAMAFQLLLLNCTSAGSSTCTALYPTTLWISVKRDNELCSIIFGKAGGEDELPDWFWWVLIALIIFLLILAWLVYRFWWKQKKSASELGDAEDELDQQQADNEAGFGKDLDVGDVAFNPMATGVPGMNRPADAFGNELHQRQLQQQNDMVDVQAEIFQVRQDYGQVATQQRHQGH